MTDSPSHPTISHEKQNFQSTYSSPSR